ncbi:endonuclease/exonuclease/phosphatase family protein [Polystyrenella longa]|nr:endonuclease/exonuclease/phosphatase family protein [Polystyrenella longa]
MLKEQLQNQEWWQNKYLWAAIPVLTWGVIQGVDRQPADPVTPIVLKNQDRCEPLERESVRLGTFNIHGFKGRDGVADILRTEKSLAELDLVVLQEAHGTPFDIWQDDVTELGEQMQMASCFAATEERYWGESFGNGLVTKIPLNQIWRIPLQGTQGRKFRNALVTCFELEGERVNLISVHLDKRQDQATQLEAVIELFRSVSAPAILLGDFNARVDNLQISALIHADDVDEVISGDQHPSDKGVDWIFTRGLRARQAEVRELGASDHPVLCGEFEIIREDDPATTPVQVTHVLPDGSRVN